MSKSIVVKLTVFVGVLVGLNTAILIGAAFWTTGAILGAQVRDRLTLVADDRQEILLHEMHRLQQARAVAFGGRPRIRSMFADRASGQVPADAFADQLGGFLTTIQRTRRTCWRSGSRTRRRTVLASGGPPELISELKAMGRPAPDPADDGWMAVPPEQVGETYAAVFCGAVRGDDGRSLGDRSAWPPTSAT